MDANLKLNAEQLAADIAAQAQTLDDLNGLIRTLMKSALERMLDTEMDAHLGRKAVATLPAAEVAASACPLPPTAATATPRRPSAANSANSPSTRPATATAPSSRS